MSAIEALEMARNAAIVLVLDGDNLLLEAPVEPPPEVLGLLTRHKAEIIALLRPGRDGWSADDWRTFFTERAAIAEFDGGLPRDRATAQAFECSVVQWLNRNPAPSVPGRCTWCGEAEGRYAAVLPYGVMPGPHTWLHAECWQGWQLSRRVQAKKVLASLGIGPISAACGSGGVLVEN